MAVKLRPLSYALGAEVCDVDVSRNMSEQAFGEIYRAFLEHGILLLRNQKITREQHIAFSRRFGELDRHDALPRDRHPQYPELLLVTNDPKPDGKPSDSHYTGRLGIPTCRSRWSRRWARCCAASRHPPVGGDTMFSNMYMAYDTLSDGMKKLIADLHGIHLSGTRKIADEESGAKRAAEQKKINPPIAQPVVRVHPETGRKALYIGEKVCRFDGMTAEESRPLIDYLCRHATRPNSSTAINGGPTTSWCGTTAARCTARSATTTKAAAPPRTHHGPGHAVGLRRAGGVMGATLGRCAAILGAGGCWAGSRYRLAQKTIRTSRSASHPVRAGWHDRPSRAARWGSISRGVGPAGRHRQPPRRQRRDGRGHGRERHARRAHAAVRRDGPRDQSADLKESAVRRAEGFHAGQPRRDLAADRDSASVGAGEQCEGADRAREDRGGSITRRAASARRSTSPRPCLHRWRKSSSCTSPIKAATRACSTPSAARST